MCSFGKSDVWRNAHPAVVLGGHDQVEMNMTYPKMKVFCAVAAMALTAPLFSAPAAAQMRSVPVIGGGGGGGGAAVSRGGGGGMRAVPTMPSGGGRVATSGMRPVPVIPGGGGGRWSGGGGRWHGGHHHRGGWWGPGIGFGAGYAIGSAYGSYPYYNNYYYDDDSYAYSPGYVESDGVSAADVAYCQQRFKSYNVRTGTYLGYDGQRHPCP